MEKEHLTREAWPGVFVEENTLVFNISVLRKLFGESSANPSYIETVPKRGYRFIAEVAELCPDGSPIANTKEESTGADPGNPIAALNRSRLRSRFARPPVILAVLFAVAACVTIAFRLRHRPKLTDRDTIVVADFSNKTGDSVFDGSLRQGVAIQLEQSPFLSPISDARIRHTLTLMSRPPDAQLTPELARDVCRRTGSTAVLEGSISSLGSEYVLGLRSKTCATGDVLYDEQEQVTKKEDVLNELTQMTRTFRSRMGESLGTIRRYDTPLMEATTSSLEALQAFSASIRVGYSRGCTASVPFGQRAVELDPLFAMAHSHLGRCYSNLGESTLAAESMAKAYQLRDRASDREKFHITLNYDRQVLGNLLKAAQVGELWAETYPRDAVSHGSLAGTIYEGLGKYEQAIAEAKKAIALDPDMAPAYVALGFTNCYLGRVGEAERFSRMAFERGLKTPDLSLLSYYVAFLENDKAEMKSVAAHAESGPASEQDYIAHSQALVLARSGKAASASDMSRRAVELSQHLGQRERAATYQAATAVWQAFFENVDTSKQNAAHALALSNGRDVEYAAAFALALAGDCTRSQSLAANLDKRYPEDTFVRFTYLPVLHGVSALKRGDPAEAIRQLQTAAPDETANPAITLFAFVGGLYRPMFAGRPISHCTTASPPPPSSRNFLIIAESF